MALKQDGAHFILFPEQRNKIESVVLNRVHIFRTFCTKQGRGFLGVQTLSDSPIPKYWSSIPHPSPGASWGRNARRTPKNVCVGG